MLYPCNFEQFLYNAIYHELCKEILSNILRKWLKYTDIQMEWYWQNGEIRLFDVWWKWNDLMNAECYEWLRTFSNFPTYNFYHFIGSFVSGASKVTKSKEWYPGISFIATTGSTQLAWVVHRLDSSRENLAKLAVCLQPGFIGLGAAILMYSYKMSSFCKSISEEIPF